MDYGKHKMDYGKHKERNHGAGSRMDHRTPKGNDEVRNKGLERHMTGAMGSTPLEKPPKD